MSEYLPNSYLLGVHLTISTHSGPLMVYSYPPARVDAITSMQQSSFKGSAQISKKNRQRDQKDDTIGNRGGTRASLTGASDFHYEVESSLRSKASMKSLSSASSLSSPSSSDSNSPWLSSEGLSDSELSTDYADESFSSDDEAIDDISNSDKSDMETGSYNNSRMSKVMNDVLQPPNDKKIDADRLLKLFDGEQDTIADDRSSVYIASEFDEDEDDDKNLKLNEEFFRDEIFQDIDKIFGFNSEFVAEFCCPDRELCNTRFEFTIDQLCFLGLPIHCDTKGKWRKSKHKRHGSKKLANSSSGSRGRKGTSLASIHTKDEVTDFEKEENMNIFNSDNKNNGLDCRIETTDAGLTNLHLENNNLGNNMHMFHVCFVLNPPLIEYNKRVDDMYQYIVAKLSILLRFIQAKSNYVSNECEIILKERENVTKSSPFYESLKTPAEKGQYLYERIITKSSLARSLTKCVDQIHKNEIACVELGGKIISLQIPINDEFQHLPEYNIDPILPNSYLTTIINSQFLEASSDSSTVLDRNMTGGHDEVNTQFDAQNHDILNYALLLKDDAQVILKTLEESLESNKSNDINNVILRQIVKNVQPTTPLISYHHIILETLQLEASSITYDILRSCALHLIYWRYARAIIPLSSKHSYFVSPLISLEDSYSTDENNFKEKFSSLPSLSYFLSKLSAVEVETTSMQLLGHKSFSPRPFGNLIPSKEHKGIYLNVLSWLIQHGYVYQLLTFIFIRVDRRIKIAVDEELESEGYKRRRAKLLDKNERISSSNVVDNSIIMNKNRERRSDVNIRSDGEERHEILELELRRRNNIDDDHFEFDDPELQQDFTIILEPERATALEKRWIYKCISDQPSDIQLLFKKLLKHFNGKTPIEIVMLNEGITRHEIKKLFKALGKYLVEIHHW